MGDGFADRRDIISAAQNKPTNLSLKRGSGESMDFKWTIPLYLTSDEYGGRTIGYIDAKWSFEASKNMDTRYREVRMGAGHQIADRLWIRDLGTSARNMSQDYDRNRYHPITLDRYLKSVVATVMFNDTVNSHPVDSKCQSSVTYKFGTPKAPKWNAPTFDTSNSYVTARLECASDEGNREYYDTYYCITRQDNFTSTYKSEKVILSWRSTRESSLDVTAGATAQAESITVGQWIRITFKAYSRGIAGNSGTVTASYVIAHPARPSITGITVTNTNASNGLVTVRFNTNATTYRPIDEVQLQALYNTGVNTVAVARTENGWADVTGAEDDGNCTGLTDTVDTAKPDRYNHVWYRVKATRGSLVQYSDPVKASALEVTATPVSNDTVKLDSVTPNDATSLRAVFGWAADDSNGTEVSWSEHGDAWESTEEPSTYMFRDYRKDAASQVTGKAYSGSLIIRGLTEGTPYYVRARRFLDTGDRVEYSDVYCSAAAAQYPATPAVDPGKVSLFCDAYVKRGEGISCSWSYESEADQKSWNLYRIAGTKKVLVASGNDQMGSAVIPSSKIPANADSVTLMVSLTSGGEWAESEQEVVKIADPPTLTAVTDGLLLAQPMRFYCACDSAGCDLIAKVKSHGTTTGTPDGELVQAEGDVIWSDRISPAWALGTDGLYYSVVVLPEGLPFVDGTDYALECTAVDRETAFQSETSTYELSVQWIHTCRPPDPATDVTVDVGARSVRISPVAPENWAEGDVYDVYRVTNDSVDLIVEGQAYGLDAVDKYAPYSRNLGLMYRIANRTKDGAVEWMDVVYDMPVGTLRFDWGDGQFVELPYNIGLQDSYEKNYESHQHMDGSVSGHWNPGYQKTGTYSTDIIKIRDAETVRTVREMATYPGPVFVRTQEGGAFEANVKRFRQLRSGPYGVSINAQAHTLSDAFRLTPDDFITVDEPDEPTEPTYTRDQILAWSDAVPVEGGTYQLNEDADGDFKVELSTSFDYYREPWTITATRSGRTVTLGTFGSALDSYLTRCQQATGTQYMLKAYYNIDTGE